MMLVSFFADLTRKVENTSLKSLNYIYIRLPCLLSSFQILLEKMKKDKNELSDYRKKIKLKNTSFE